MGGIFGFILFSGAIYLRLQHMKSVLYSQGNKSTEIHLDLSFLNHYSKNMKPITYCSSIQKHSHIQTKRYPKYLDSFVPQQELGVLVQFLYIKSHLFLIYSFTGALILKSFGELQSGLMADVMHNTWNSSESTNTHTHTKRVKCSKRVTYFHYPFHALQTFAMEYNNALDSQQKFVSKRRKTKSSAEYITPKLSAIQGFIELAHSDQMSVHFHTSLILFCSSVLLFDRESSFSLSSLSHSWHDPEKWRGSA